MKYIPWIIIVLLLSGLSFYFYKSQKDTEALLSLKNSKLMEANLELGRAKTEIVNQKKVHKIALSKIEEKWKEEIKKRNALIVSFGELKAKYEAEKKKVKTITKIIYKERNTDRQIDIPKNKLFVKTDDNEFKQVTSLTYSYSDFRINIEGDAIKETISYKLHQKFKAQLIESKLPSGARNHYIKIYEIDDQDKVINELELSEFNVIRSKELQNHFHWFNPKLDLGVTGGFNTSLQGMWAADIGFSISSYGKTRNDLLLRFLRIGLGVSNNGFIGTLSPIQINIGNFLPIISNLYFTPLVGLDIPKIKTYIGFGFSVVF